jgi:hypothetical protein
MVWSVSRVGLFLVIQLPFQLVGYIYICIANYNVIAGVTRIAPD